MANAFVTYTPYIFIHVEVTLALRSCRVLHCIRVHSCRKKPCILKTAVHTATYLISAFLSASLFLSFPLRVRLHTYDRYKYQQQRYVGSGILMILIFDNMGRSSLDPYFWKMFIHMHTTNLFSIFSLSLCKMCIQYGWITWISVSNRHG